MLKMFFNKIIHLNFSVIQKCAVIYFSKSISYNENQTIQIFSITIYYEKKLILKKVSKTNEWYSKWNKS